MPKQCRETYFRFCSRTAKNFATASLDGFSPTGNPTWPLSKTTAATPPQSNIAATSTGNVPSLQALKPSSTPSNWASTITHPANVGEETQSITQCVSPQELSQGCANPSPTSNHRYRRLRLRPQAGRHQDHLHGRDKGMEIASRREPGGRSASANILERAGPPFPGRRRTTADRISHRGRPAALN